MTVKILVAVAFSMTMVLAQSEHHEGSHSEHSEGSHSAHQEGAATYPCPMLQAEHDKMTQKMTAMNMKVAQLAKEMKQAQGDQKVRMMESLLEALVEQRSVLHDEMISMLPKMMDWVARHSGGEGHACPHSESGHDSSGK